MNSGVKLTCLPRAIMLSRSFSSRAPLRDVPLAGGDDLQRLVALLEELHRVADRLRLADEFAGLAQQLDHLGLGAEHGLAGDFRVGGLGGIRRDHIRGVGDDAAVAADDGAVGQVEFAPPDHVGDVAEGADHRDAAALVLLGEVVGEHRHLDAEDRGGHGRAEQRLVALVIRMRHQRHAGRQQLRAGGLDVHVGAVRAVEGDPVVGGGDRLVLELGLGDGGAEGDVPQGGRLGLVGLAAGQVAQEGALGGGLRLRADGAVGLGPVDGQAELAPERLELLLVLGGERLAQLDEVAPADRLLVGGLGALVVAALERRGEVRLVRERGVAAHAVVVLHPALGGQAVVVPAHRVEDALAAHPLVAGDEVHVGVAEDVADVQRAGCRGRGSVDGEDRMRAGR